MRTVNIVILLLLISLGVEAKNMDKSAFDSMVREIRFEYVTILTNQLEEDKHDFWKGSKPIKDKINKNTNYEDMCNTLSGNKWESVERIVTRLGNPQFDEARSDNILIYIALRKELIESLPESASKNKTAWLDRKYKDTLLKKGKELENKYKRQGDTVVPPPPPPPPPPPGNNNCSWLSLLISFITGLVSGVVALTIWLRKNGKTLFNSRTKKDEENEKMVKEYVRENRDLDQSLKSKDQDIEELKKEVTSLKLELNSKNKEIDDLKVKTTVIESKQEPSTINNVSKEKLPDLYLPIPNGNTFNDSKAEYEERSESSYYRFERINETKAKYRFINNAHNIANVKSYRKDVIEAVCNSENNFWEGIKEVETIKEGTAELKDGQWVVIEKAKIKYK